MAAYIGAEQQIIANSSNGMADGMEFYVEHDPFGNPAVVETTVKEQQIQRLEAQMLEMEEAGRKLLEQENYELMRELKEIYELTKKQIRNLKR